ncbi:hypothetical protein NPIL_452011 [Nephila pilipes]|uniref:Uncharacterized protein n=1 Tax=Nephila pilipes TaxID=299642 RepID=A0A8X6QPX9_NEPPI|nr:hypothetical protein NPIL_452011 [Nephila pilipes]
MASGGSAHGRLAFLISVTTGFSGWVTKITTSTKWEEWRKMKLYCSIRPEVQQPCRKSLKLKRGNNALSCLSVTFVAVFDESIVGALEEENENINQTAGRFLFLAKITEPHS